MSVSQEAELVPGHDLTTPTYLRERLGRTNPLLLPLSADSPVVVDFAVLPVLFPMATGELAPPGGVDLRPLARISRKHRTRLAGETWNYEWFYLELLSIEARLRPVCWASEDVLIELRLQELEHDLLETGGHYTREAEALAREVDGIRQRRSQEWLEAGELVREVTGPWTALLTLRAPEQCPGPEQGDPLRFAFTPLYAPRVRTVERLHREALLETYTTSIFNPEAGPRQDAAQWELRRRRFHLDVRRRTQRQSLSRERERLALEMFTKGASNNEVAQAWLDRGYHPLPTAEGEAIPAAPNHRESARRTVLRLKEQLRASGALPPDIMPRRRPGRPRKAD